MYIGNKNMKSNQFVSNKIHIDLFMLWYFLLKNKLYNPAIHKFHINDVTNHDTINNNGNIGFFQESSVNDHHTAVKIINNNQEITAQTTIHINILPNISHQDDWSGVSVKLVAIVYCLLFVKLFTLDVFKTWRKAITAFLI